jgi:preprotein translocase subunit SecE
MGKVTWPTREELAESTKVVIIVCVIISAFTWGVDTLLSAALKAIL